MIEVDRMVWKRDRENGKYIGVYVNPESGQTMAVSRKTVLEDLENVRFIPEKTVLATVILIDDCSDVVWRLHDKLTRRNKQIKHLRETVKSTLEIAQQTDPLFHSHKCVKCGKKIDALMCLSCLLCRTP